MRLYEISGALCSDCGHEFTAADFRLDDDAAWPVRCSEKFVRSPLHHPRVFGGCGGRLLLLDVRRVDDGVLRGSG